MLIALLHLLLLPIFATLLLAAPTASAAVDPAEPTSRPPVTANPFLPEERSLTECVGALERPGCGSKERGGWRQTLVFIAVISGLGLVFWRIALTVRRNRVGLDA